MSAAVYTHLDHILRVELPWTSSGQLGESALSADLLHNASLSSSTNATAQIAFTTLHLNATHLCSSDTPMAVPMGGDNSGLWQITPVCDQSTLHQPGD
jgi:hypothetical protein